jgi:hypothetical protein
MVCKIEKSEVFYYKGIFLPKIPEIYIDKSWITFSINI